MKVRRIPTATVSRLPIYANCLAKMAEEGIESISSTQWSKAAGVSAAQLRKDLSYLGDFGTRGIGYEVKYLLREIVNYIGLSREWRVAIVGFGRLGSALAHYRGFREGNIRVVAAFDVDVATVGNHLPGLVVHSVQEMDRIVEEKKVDLGIITTPASVAQQIADRLTSAGVKSILNFAPTQLIVSSDVCLRQIDVATEIQILTFYETMRASLHTEDIVRAGVGELTLVS